MHIYDNISTWQDQIPCFNIFFVCPYNHIEFVLSDYSPQNKPYLNYLYLEFSERACIARGGGAE